MELVGTGAKTEAIFALAVLPSEAGDAGMGGDGIQATCAPAGDRLTARVDVSTDHAVEVAVPDPSQERAVPGGLELIKAAEVVIVGEMFGLGLGDSWTQLAVAAFVEDFRKSSPKVVSARLGELVFIDDEAAGLDIVSTSMLMEAVTFDHGGIKITAGLVSTAGAVLISKVAVL